MNGPGRMLLELILVAIAIGGFLYGMHWKTIATDLRLNKKGTGSAEIQRQLDALEKTNAELIQKVEQYEAEKEAL